MFRNTENIYQDVNMVVGIRESHTWFYIIYVKVYTHLRKNKSVLALKEKRLGLQKSFVSLSHNHHLFSQPEVKRLTFLALEPWAGGPSVGLGCLLSQGGPLQQRYPSQSLTSIHGCGTNISAPSTSLQWFLLYILSYRASVWLDFRQFWMMTVLQFSCNFDVVVGGGEHW